MHASEPKLFRARVLVVLVVLVVLGSFPGKARAGSVPGGCVEMEGLSQGAQLRAEGRLDEALEAISCGESVGSAWSEQRVLEYAWTLAFAQRVDEAVRLLEGREEQQGLGLEAQLGLARMQIWLSQHRAARRRWRALSRQHPERADVAAGEASAALARGALARAEGSYERALQLEPDQTEAREGLERVASIKRGHLAGLFGLQSLDARLGLSARAHLDYSIRSWLRLDLDYQSASLEPSALVVGQGLPNIARVGLSGMLGRRWLYGFSASSSWGLAAGGLELSADTTLVELGGGYRSERAGTFGLYASALAAQADGPNLGLRGNYEKALRGGHVVMGQSFHTWRPGVGRTEHAVVIGLDLGLGPSSRLGLSGGARLARFSGSEALIWVVGAIGALRYRYQVNARFAYLAESSITAPNPRVWTIRTGLELAF